MLILYFLHIIYYVYHYALLLINSYLYCYIKFITIIICQYILA